MPALEMLVGRVVAPDTTITGLTMNTSNSLTVRNTPDGTAIKLLQAWVDSQTAGTLRIRSPRLHDDVEGIRINSFASEVSPLLPAGFSQNLIPQDTLRVELSGSSTAGDVESVGMLIHYETLPGIEGRFATPDEIKGRQVSILTVENTLALGTAQDYSGEEALNAEFDLLKGNTDYALIGYHVSAECVAVRWRSSDFGNLGVGGPGNPTDKVTTGRWFADLSDMHGLPLIPIFNSANIDNILVDGAQDEVGTDVTLTTILVELSS
jgi:hypothetical protein